MNPKIMIGAALLYFLFKNRTAAAATLSTGVPQNQDVPNDAMVFTSPVESVVATPEVIDSLIDYVNNEDLNIRYSLSYAPHLGLISDTVKAGDLFYDQVKANQEVTRRASAPSSLTNGEWTAEHIVLDNGRNAWIISFQRYLRAL